MSCSLVGEMRRRPSSDRVMERYHGIFTGESRSQSLMSTQLEVRSTPRRLSLVGRTAEAVPCAQSVCCSSRDKIFFGESVQLRCLRPLQACRCKGGLDCRHLELVGLFGHDGRPVHLNLPSLACLTRAGLGLPLRPRPRT